MSKEIQNLRERRIYYRYYYNSNSHIATFIDEKSSLEFNVKEINPDTKLGSVDYINNFFIEMVNKLNLWEVTRQIVREWLIIGNCTIFFQENHVDEVSSNCHDKNILYNGWESAIIISPNDIVIEGIPLSNKRLFKYIPNSEFVELVNKKNIDIPKYFVDNFKDKNPILLNTDPFIGSFASLFMHRLSPYDIVGQSIIERHIDDLKQKKEISLFISDHDMEMFKRQLKIFFEEKVFSPVSVKKGFFDCDKKVIYPEVIIK